jgi:ABC-2 type transport system permease protein
VGTDAEVSGVSLNTTEVAPVREAGGRVADDLRAVRVVWRRELIRFLRNRPRMVTALVQPVLFLLVLGSGLARMIPNAGAGIDFRTFMFPGVLAMTVLFTSIFSAVSIVWDREFGFMREMLVAPVRRGALVVGKCLGGATVATIQGGIMLVLAGLVHVPYSPALIGVLILEMALAALALTAIGTLIASGVARIESFQVVIQFLVLPMFFLSGALFPLANLPRWLEALTMLDPLSYAVDPMRREVFSHLTVPPALTRTLDPGISWGGWRLPVLLELGLVAALAAIALVFAGLRFSRTE